MSTAAFFFADQNGPFLVAMAATLAIAALELASLLLGLGLSDFLDNLLPDLDADVDVDVDLDAGVDLDGDMDLDGDAGPGHVSDTNLFGYVLGWINAGRVPFLILLVTYLAMFAVIGFAAQSIAKSMIGLIPALIAAPAAAFAALPPTRWISRIVGRLVPREETYAVGEAQFVGLVGTVTLGPVEAANPGKAKVIDRHGNKHFVRVRSANPGERFESGSQVLLVERRNAVFEAIPAPSSLAAAREVKW